MTLQEGLRPRGHHTGDLVLSVHSPWSSALGPSGRWPRPALCHIIKTHCISEANHTSYLMILSSLAIALWEKRYNSQIFQFPQQARWDMGERRYLAGWYWRCRLKMGEEWKRGQWPYRPAATMAMKIDLGLFDSQTFSRGHGALEPSVG